jgi:hypothetical protein
VDGPLVPVRKQPKLKRWALVPVKLLMNRD